MQLKIKAFSVFVEQHSSRVTVQGNTYECTGVTTAVYCSPPNSSTCSIIDDYSKTEELLISISSADIKQAFKTATNHTPASHHLHWLPDE